MMKKITLKLMIMGLVATSLLASCNKNEKTDSMGFKAVTEQKSGNSKTHGVLNGDKTEYEVQWTTADQILVNNGEETRHFELTSGENTTSGDFYTSDGATFNFAAGTFYAAYPAANASGTENTVSNAGVATFNLPSTQAYLDNSFAEKAMPMVAYATNRTLHFKNVLGGICFPVKGSVHVTKIVLTSNNTQDKLWGTFTADCTSAEPTLTYVSGGSNVIELTSNINLTSDGLDFNILVPPGTLANGFNVKVYNGSTVLYDKTVTWATAQNNFMERNFVKVLQEAIPATNPLTVKTYSPIWIKTTSAKAGAKVVSGEFTTLGIIYAKASALSNPANDLVLGGTGVTNLVTSTNSTVTADMTGLDINTIYYVRAYAKTADGEIGMTYYGDPIPFATRRVYTDLNGKLPYPFTAASGRQVYFSVGNLQYQASTKTWRFAEFQYDFVGSLYGPDAAPIGLVEGSDNHLISATYSGWIDLFGWGTSGYNHNNACYQPWSTLCDDDGDYQKYWAYGDGNANLYDGNGKADWGWNNISNDGSYVENSGWRVLKGGNPSLGFPDSELYYLLNSRNISKRYMEVRVKVKGNFDHQPNPIALIIFPDNFVWPTATMGSDAAFKFNQTANLDAGGENALTEAQWSLLEEKGAALLPAGGSRHGNEVHIQGRQFYYWTSTKMYGTSQMGPALKRAWALDGGNGYVNPTYNEHVTGGQSVRLVRNN